MTTYPLVPHFRDYTSDVTTVRTTDRAVSAALRHLRDVHLRRLRDVRQVLLLGECSHRLGAAVPVDAMASGGPIAAPEGMLATRAAAVRCPTPRRAARAP